MNSRSAELAILSPLMSQLPRRSSDSQPYTAGTFGHFAMAWATSASMKLESSPGGAMGSSEAIAEERLHGAGAIYLSRPWLGHYSPGVPAEVEVPLKSVPQAFDEATARAPDRTA